MDVTIHDLDTVMLSPEVLKPYENNAKKHTKKQIEHIANSIREFGFNDNVGVWTNEKGEYEIVTGHGTVEAAKLLGLSEIPCDILDHLSDTERRAYCHVHNQTSLETGFDYDTLTEDMDNLDVDWDGFGLEHYTYENLDAFFTEDEQEGDTFSLTLKMPLAYKEQVDAFIEGNGKDALVQEVAMLVSE